MSKCANSKLHNCPGIIVQKGNIYCDSCLETKRSETKNKREHELDQLLIKNSELECELKKRSSQSDLLFKLQEDNISLIKEKSLLETTVSQFRLDIEKLKLDNDKLKSLLRLSESK